MRIILYIMLLGLLSACDSLGIEGGDTSQYPQRKKLDRAEDRGSLTGDGLLVIGGDSQEDESGNSPIGVNAYLWRATLDTLAFMPLTSADPFGGVIITDWYEDPKARGERFKVTALILGRSLRVDGLKVSLFKQHYDTVQGGWRDVEVEEKLERKLEDTILTRARQLRVKDIGE